MKLCGFSPTVLRNTNAFSPFYINVLPIFEDSHVAPTFSFLWDKQFQIPYLFLIFCSPDPLWPWTFRPGLTLITACLRRISSEQDGFFFSYFSTDNETGVQ